MKTIHVYAGWAAIDEPVLVGVASASLVRGKEVISFEFNRDWIRNFAGLLLDPKLRMTRGPQYADHRERGSFGLLTDSAPDRWGRLLMKRREALLARQEDRRERPLV